MTGPFSSRIVIAGAASLRGKEIAEAIGESSLAAADLRLLDEEIAAGRLAAAAGEATVIQVLGDDSFEGASLVIFAGSAAFTSANIDRALASGARIIDMSGATISRTDAITWIPTLDAILPPSIAATSQPKSASKIYASPDAGAIAAAILAAAFAEWPDARISITLLRPVSERSQEAVEELEAQTVKLLSLQTLPKAVFDSQVAFNLTDRYGENCGEKLADVQSSTRRAIRAALPPSIAAPAIRIIQAPVFFGYSFSAFVEFAKEPDVPAIEARLTASGFEIRSDSDEPPSNVNVAGERKPLLARPQSDANRPNGIWLWGVADNIRLAAANALGIAEKVLAS